MFCSSQVLLKLFLSFHLAHVSCLLPATFAAPCEPHTWFAFLFSCFVLVIFTSFFSCFNYFWGSSCAFIVDPVCVTDCFPVAFSSHLHVECVFQANSCTILSFFQMVLCLWFPSVFNLELFRLFVQKFLENGQGNPVRNVGGGGGGGYQEHSSAGAEGEINKKEQLLLLVNWKHNNYYTHMHRLHTIKVESLPLKKPVLWHMITSESFGAGKTHIIDCTRHKSSEKKKKKIKCKNMTKSNPAHVSTRSHCRKRKKNLMLRSSLIIMKKEKKKARRSTYACGFDSVMQIWKKWMIKILIFCAGECFFPRNSGIRAWWNVVGSSWVIKSHGWLKSKSIGLARYKQWSGSNCRCLHTGQQWRW